MRIDTIDNNRQIDRIGKIFTVNQYIRPQVPSRCGVDPPALIPPLPDGSPHPLANSISLDFSKGEPCSRPDINIFTFFYLFAFCAHRTTTLLLLRPPLLLPSPLLHRALSLRDANEITTGIWHLASRIMLWGRRHVTAFAAVFTIILLFLGTRLHNPGTVVSRCFLSLLAFP
jgi:hypothetical protein